MKLQLCSSDWMGEVSVLQFEIQFQELLYKSWLRKQEYSASRQFNVGVSLKPGLHERPLFRNSWQALVFKNLSPVSHQEHFFLGIFFLKAHRSEVQKLGQDQRRIPLENLSLPFLRLWFMISRFKLPGGNISLVIDSVSHEYSPKIGRVSRCCLT